MNKFQCCLLLLATALLAVQCHRKLAEEQLPERSLAEADAAEHQRILAELEEVHQLRERMLQEGIHTISYFLIVFLTAFLTLAACWQCCDVSPRLNKGLNCELTQGLFEVS